VDWIVSLTPEVTADPAAALTNPPSGATIVELRIDRFPGIDIRSAIASCPLPILVTLRSTAEGGEGPDDGVSRAEILSSARNAGAALLDLEYDRDADLIKALGLPPEQVVLSWHDPQGTPDNIAKLAEGMLELPARWVKIVPTARSLGDLGNAVALHNRFNNVPIPKRRLLAFAMGTPGLASRYLSPLMGPPIGYASWREDAPAAPGQLSIDVIERVISHLNGPPQRLYGVVGADVAGSLSPALHAAGYQGLGLPYLLVPISIPDPAELGEIFTPLGETLFDRLGLETRGWAVTSPYKAQAAAAADHAAPRVQRAGAANTLVLGAGRVFAENTDADGVVGSLMNIGINPQGRSALVQGSGGAARGAAVGLHLAGADVVLRSRSSHRAQAVAEEMALDWCSPDESQARFEILVNATPLGGNAGEPGPFAVDTIRQATAVVDMVYASQPTDLTEKARDLGVAVADGRDVLLHQGYAQFAAFTNVLPPKEAMKKAIGI
jgi:shikimate dehydrogenase/3-dehydroquinate dehydratase type I